MPWAYRKIGEKRWLKSPFTWGGVAVAVCLLLLVLPRVQERYARWTERRGIGRAAAAFHRGDFKQAIVDARGVLRKNPRSTEATRVIARALEAMKAPQALNWRRELETIQSGDVENLLGLADAGMNAGDFASAERALKKLKPEDQTSARYHDLAARIARQRRDAAGAESHWAEAVRLEPKNDQYRLALAAVQLGSDQAATRAAALAFLEPAAETPALRLPALRVLLADATARRETRRMRELSARVTEDPEAGFNDRVTRLGLLRSTRAPEAGAYLTQLQESVAADIRETSRLMTWMNENNLALAVIEWESTLPPATVAGAPVAAALADAYARAADWQGLKEKIEHVTWEGLEFLRLAFLSRACERLDDANAGNAAWTTALNTAQTRPDWLEALARAARSWGWKERTEETLWKLVASDRCPRWALEALWTSALQRQDSPRLYDAAKLLVKADPTSVAFRNNYIALALLTGQNADAPHDLAAALYRQHADHPTVASTYGFSLFQQGRAEEAVKVMERLKPDDLRAPLTAIYCGIFLAAAGQTERAHEFFQLGAKASVLPEEKVIVDFLSAACRARALEVGGDAAASTAAWREATTAAEERPEWLEMLGKMALDWKWKPQVEALAVKLASLERCPAWAIDPLWQAAVKSGDSALLHRAGRLIVRTDPTRVEIRNRTLAVALLTGREVEATQRQVALLAREQPGAADLAATHGFALYQQGKAGEAVALLKNFAPAQLQAPAVALYPGLFLASTGRKDEAAPFLKIAAQAPLLPEERALLAKAEAGAPAPTSTAAAAPALPAPAAELPPVAAIDRTRRDTAQLFKEARERMLAEPKNPAARSNYLLLALLTGQSADSARQLARVLYKELPTDVTAACIYGLSLHQQGKSDEAVQVMEALPPAQLREPPAALYFGHFLAGCEAPEQAARAPEFLALAAKSPLLPEEQAFLSAGKK